MNVHDRIEAALKGQLADQVPFTIYSNKIPKGEAERRLRGKGLGFSWRQNIIDWEYPNCDIRTVTWRKDGQDLSRTIYSTPVGEIYEVNRLEGEYGSTWKVEWPVKTREDYRVMTYVTRDARPVPLYDEFARTMKNVGGDGFVVANFLYEPLMYIIVNCTGFEAFAYHMVDWPDEFWSLHDALVEKTRRAYPVAAAGPQYLTLFGGNDHPAVLGRERFAKYNVPRYNEFADILHERGKILACHLDANNAEWADLVAASKLDAVEAFTPPPDCNLSVADARRAWPNKVLSLNFPSSLHLASREVIREATVEILRQAGDGSRLLMGITEDVPADCWEKSLETIADTLNEFGRLPLKV